MGVSKVFILVLQRGRLYQIALIATLLFGALSSAAMAQVITGTLSNATTQTGRLYRNSVTSTCASPKANPGLFQATGIRAQVSYSGSNTSGVSQCYTITLSYPDPQRSLYAVAYLGSFSPADPAASYLGDYGSSSSPSTFSVNVPSGQTLLIVVHELDPGQSVGETYTLTVSPPVTATPVPTLSQWAMLLLGLILAGGAAVMIDRQRGPNPLM